MYSPESCAILTLSRRERYIWKRQATASGVAEFYYITVDYGDSTEQIKAYLVQE